MPSNANFSVLAAYVRPSLVVEIPLCGRRFADCPCGLSLLSHRLEEDDRHRRRQIQAPCPLHWDRETIFLIVPQQLLGQAFGFSPKDKEIALTKFPFIISIPKLRRQIKIPGFRRLLMLQLSN